MIPYSIWASLVAQMVKNLSAMQEPWVWSLGWKDPLEKEMATHSNILAWRIPWTEESGGLWSMGSQRIRHDWATFIHSVIQYLFFSGLFYFVLSPPGSAMHAFLFYGWVITPLCINTRLSIYSYTDTGKANLTDTAGLVPDHHNKKWVWP